MMYKEEASSPILKRRSPAASDLAWRRTAIRSCCVVDRAEKSGVSFKIGAFTVSCDLPREIIPTVP